MIFFADSSVSSGSSLQHGSYSSSCPHRFRSPGRDCPPRARPDARARRMHPEVGSGQRSGPQRQRDPYLADQERPDRLQRHPALCRRGRAFCRHRSGARLGQCRVRLGDQPHRRRADGVQHQDENGHLLQRVRHRQPGKPRRRAQPVRLAGARRLFLGRDHREARAENLPHHPRRVHHLRAADAAMGDGRELGHHDAREARGAHQHGPQGEGRAGLLPAGDVLPDQQGRPRDRVPPSDLRQFHDQGADAQ